jgi:integrase
MVKNNKKIKTTEPETKSRSKWSKHKKLRKTPCPICLISYSATNISKHIKLCEKKKKMSGGIEKAEQVDPMCLEYEKKIKALEEKNKLLEEKIGKMTEENILIKRQTLEIMQVASMYNLNVSHICDKVPILLTEDEAIKLITMEIEYKHTLKNYINKFKRYVKFCESTGLNFALAASANSYINSLRIQKMIQKLPITRSLVNLRACLQSMLRIVSGQNIRLNNLRRWAVRKNMRKVYFLKRDQLVELYENLKNNYPDEVEYYLALRIQIETGARISEIVNLKMEDVLFLEKGVFDSIIINEFKTKKTRTKKLSSELRTLICQYIRENKIKSGFLFLKNFKDDDHKIRSDNFGKKLNQMLWVKLDNGIIIHPKTHDIRRSYCDNFHEDRMKCLEATRIEMNHSNKNVTANFYINTQNIKPGALHCYRTNPEDDAILKHSLTNALKKRNLIFTNENVYESEELMKKVIKFCNKNAKKIERFDENDAYQINKFLCRSEEMRNGPLEVVLDKYQGFVVVATNFIPQFTIISEYVGNVQPHDPNFNHNSIMKYISDDKTSYDIIPRTHANLSIFLSGTEGPNSEFQNVFSIKRRLFNNIPQIFFIAMKDIEQDEILYYDYNAGGQGQYPIQNFEMKKTPNRVENWNVQFFG